MDDKEDNKWNNENKQNKTINQIQIYLKQINTKQINAWSFKIQWLCSKCKQLHYSVWGLSLYQTSNWLGKKENSKIEKTFYYTQNLQT